MTEPYDDISFNHYDQTQYSFDTSLTLDKIDIEDSELNNILTTDDFIIQLSKLDNKNIIEMMYNRKDEKDIGIIFDEYANINYKNIGIFLNTNENVELNQKKIEIIHAVKKSLGIKIFNQNIKYYCDTFN